MNVRMNTSVPQPQIALAMKFGAKRGSMLPDGPDAARRIDDERAERRQYDAAEHERADPRGTIFRRDA